MTAACGGGRVLNRVGTGPLEQAARCTPVATLPLPGKHLLAHPIPLPRCAHGRPAGSQLRTLGTLGTLGSVSPPARMPSTLFRAQYSRTSTGGSWKGGWGGCGGVGGVGLDKVHICAHVSLPAGLAQGRHGALTSLRGEVSHRCRRW